MTSEQKPSLEQLEMRGDFVRRHIGPGDPQIAEMLEALGLASLDELIEQTVPASIISDDELALPEAMSERETVSYLRRMRERNQIFVSMVGMGYSGTVTPAFIKGNVSRTLVGTPRIRRTRPRSARVGWRRC